MGDSRLASTPVEDGRFFQNRLKVGPKKVGDERMVPKTGGPKQVGDEVVLKNLVA